MSVRAHKVTTKYEKGENIKITDTNSFVFNVWSEGHIFDLILDYGNDFTNEDSCGIIEIHVESLEELIVEERDKLTNDELVRLKSLLNEYKLPGVDEEWIQLDCF